jgi:hypothetical protein
MDITTLEEACDHLRVFVDRIDSLNPGLEFAIEYLTRLQALTVAQAVVNEVESKLATVLNEVVENHKKLEANGIRTASLLKGEPLEVDESMHDYGSFEVHKIGDSNQFRVFFENIGYLPALFEKHTDALLFGAVSSMGSSFTDRIVEEYTTSDPDHGEYILEGFVYGNGGHTFIDTKEGLTTVFPGTELTVVEDDKGVCAVTYTTPENRVVHSAWERGTGTVSKENLGERASQYFQRVKGLTYGNMHIPAVSK